MVQAAVARHRGRQSASSRDDSLAAFDGPARAVRCAAEIVTRSPRLGLRVRAGVHTGEVTVIGDEIVGVAVELAARVAVWAVEQGLLHAPH